MKVNDLRVNNLIKHNGQTLYIIHISSNNGEGELSCSFIPTKDTWFNVKEANPIPLTEEWLVMFGYVKYQFDEVTDRWSHEDCIYDVEVHGDKVAFCIYDAEVPATTHYICHSYFVHEFQNNFFALSKKELTYKP